MSLRYLGTFIEHIEKMNAKYELPVLPTDSSAAAAMAARFNHFQNIYDQEMDEGEDIERKLEELKLMTAPGPEDILAIRVAMADWLGDRVVYLVSEMLRWGIPPDAILSIIMHSNFSKLGVDGKPIKDERGKFLKGPYYWKPEPVIAEVLGGPAAAPVTEQQSPVTGKEDGK